MNVLKFISTISCLSAFVACLGCGKDSNQTINRTQQGIFGIEIVQASNEDFGPTFEVARSAGLQFAEISVPWDDIESSPGQFRSEVLGDAGGFYSSQNVPLLVILSPIDTNNLRVPPDLRGKSFASEEVRSRFHALLDFAMFQIGDVEVVAFAIGNEVDFFLGTDNQQWSDYAAFLQDARDYIHQKRPGAQVGTIFGFDGIRSNRAKNLLAVSDVAMTTYYPLNEDFSVRALSEVKSDFAQMVAGLQGQKLIVTECGYPSASLLGGSEQLQSEFVSTVLDAWSSHVDQISHLSYFSLTDYSQDFVAQLGTYYGLQDERFLAYLGSLGLRRADGSPKAAFETLKRMRMKSQ